MPRPCAARTARHRRYCLSDAQLRVIDTRHTGMTINYPMAYKYKYPGYTS